MMIIPASTHETSDAPPAAFAAVSAPSSQPEPMIEPSEMNINDVRPTLRRRPLGAPFASDTTYSEAVPSGPIRPCCARPPRLPSASRVITGCDSVKPL